MNAEEIQAILNTHELEIDVTENTKPQDDEPDDEPDGGGAIAEDANEPVTPPPAVVPPVPAEASVWIKLSLGAAVGLALAAATIGLINRSVLGSQIELLAAENRNLLQRCAFNQSSFRQLAGNPGDPDRPLWNARKHILDLDREFIGQVSTHLGSVNVIRLRPKSLNERTRLRFEITNPNAVTLHRGQLILRTSSQSHDPANDHDYESLRRWHKSLFQHVSEIKELAPGETCVVEVSATSDAEQSDPEYVDFEISFGYYSAVGKRNGEGLPSE